MTIEYLGEKELYCFQWDYIDSNMFALFENGEALVIDPVLTTETKQFFKQKTISKIWILLTHEHFDHINGLNWLRTYFDCEVIANSVCALNIKSESKNLSNKSEVILLFNKNIRDRNISVLPFECSADIIFEQEKVLHWQNHMIELITTPGHTNGSICIIFDEKYLFTGDTLLDIPTITRLPGGSKKNFEQITLPFLRRLRSQIVKVYPGHGSFGSLDKMLSLYDKNCNEE